MSKNKPFKAFPTMRAEPAKPRVASLLDAMKDGNEYASLLDVDLAQPVNLRDELRRAIAAVEAIRQRPLLVYAGNAVSTKADVPSGIVLADDLPFAEMVSLVPASEKAVDVMVVTPGGVAQQVAQFVARLRPRFDYVAYIVPQIAMSAGTIWVLSGDEIVMDERASIGPIDPQVPGREGRFLPAQAILGLIETIRTRGEERIKQGANPAWTDQMLLRQMDAKEIGAAHSATLYSIQLAANYLETFKLRSWVVHKNGNPVTPRERSDRALEIATALCDHQQWKAHSHGISRDVAWNTLRLKISHPEDVPGLQRAMRRLWAIFYWAFENTAVVKVYLSQQYALFRNIPQTGANK
jgi:hypothetical protein